MYISLRNLSIRYVEDRCSFLSPGSVSHHDVFLNSSVFQRQSANKITKVYIFLSLQGIKTSERHKTKLGQSSDSKHITSVRRSPAEHVPR